MKPTPTRNYDVEVRDLVNEHDWQPELAPWLAGGWLLRLNHFVCISFLPHLPNQPWPPPPAEDLDRAADADEAARIIVSTSELIVAPTDGDERIDELDNHPVIERQSVFWLSRARYASLDTALAALNEHLGEWVFRDDLPDGALRRFLEHDLPRAGALDEYARTLLCLPPRRSA